jgi:hypothetical protein
MANLELLVNEARPRREAWTLLLIDKGTANVCDRY